MLLYRQRPAITEPAVPKAEPARSGDGLRLLLDQIAEMWAANESMSGIGDKLGGVTRNRIAGLIDRAREKGDVRFRPRIRPPGQTREQRVEADRERYRRRRPSAVQRVVEDVAPIVEEPTPAGATPAPRPATLIELESGQCKYAVTDPPLGRAVETLFCAAPVERPGSPWCTKCAVKVRGGAGTGGKFVLRVVTHRLG
jgi:hypothetical protein